MLGPKTTTCLNDPYEQDIMYDWLKIKDVLCSPYHSVVLRKEIDMKPVGSRYRGLRVGVDSWLGMGRLGRGSFRVIRRKEIDSKSGTGRRPRIRLDNWYGERLDRCPRHAVGCPSHAVDMNPVSHPRIGLGKSYGESLDKCRRYAVGCPRHAVGYSRYAVGCPSYAVDMNPVSCRRLPVGVDSLL